MVREIATTRILAISIMWGLRFFDGYHPLLLNDARCSLSRSFVALLFASLCEYFGPPKMYKKC